MTELKKFGVVELVHFHKGILTSHVAELPFQKIYICLEGYIFFVKEERTDIFTLQVTIKNLC